MPVTWPGRGSRSTSAGWGRRSKNFYVETAERFGHGASARRVQELFAAGDRAGAAAALSDELIESSAICCRPGELGERVAWYERAGATTLLAMPFGDRPRIVEELAGVAAARPSRRRPGPARARASPFRLVGDLEPALQNRDRLRRAAGQAQRLGRG